KDLRPQIESALDRLDIDDKKKQIKELELVLSSSEVWNDPDDAQGKSKKLAVLKSVVDPWETLRAQVQDIYELMELGDDSLIQEFDGQIAALENEYDRLRKDLLFDGEYDSRGALLRLSAGAGGTDAQDWTEMLERMYLRWAEKSDMTARVVERSPSEEA